MLHNKSRLFCRFSLQAEDFGAARGKPARKGKRAGKHLFFSRHFPRPGVRNAKSRAGRDEPDSLRAFALPSLPSRCREGASGGEGNAAGWETEAGDAVGAPLAGALVLSAGGVSVLGCLGFFSNVMEKAGGKMCFSFGRPGLIATQPACCSVVLPRRAFGPIFCTFPSSTQPKKLSFLTGKAL